MNRAILTSLLFCACIGSLWGQMPQGRDTLYGHEWIRFNQTYAAFKVGKDGIYRIPSSTLGQLNLGGQVGNRYQLFCRGQEVPIYVSSGDAVLGTDDYLEFVGHKNQGEMDRFLYLKPDVEQLNPYFSLVSDTATYFLTIAPANAPTLRYRDHSNDFGPNTRPFNWGWRTERLVFTDKHHNATYDFEDLVTYSDYDQGEGYAADFQQNRQIQLNLPGYLNAGVNAQLKVRLLAPSKPENAFRLRSRRTEAPQDGNGQLEVSDTLHWHETRLFSQNLAPNAQSANMQIQWEGRLAISFAEIRYAGNFSFNRANFFHFELEPNAQASWLELRDLPNSVNNLVLYDLKNLQRFIPEKTAAGFRFSLPVGSNAPELWAAGQEGGITLLTQGRTVQMEDFRSLNANYLIITHPNLRRDDTGRDQVNEYATYRSSPAGGNWRVQIVDVTQLYDVLGYGLADHPQALRNLGALLRKNRQAPHIFLLGHGMEYPLLRGSDPRARAEQLIPTFGSPGSDNLLFSPLGQLVPFFPVARLAVIQGAQVKNYLDKVITYERSLLAPRDAASLAWRKRALHMAGGSGGEIGIFNFRLDRAGQALSQSGFGASIQAVSKESSEAVQETVSDKVINSLNAGVAIKTFLGHGGVAMTDFGLDDPNLFEPQGRYPLIFSLGCLTGKTCDLQQSLSERFVLEPRKGGIAYVATAGFANDAALEFFLKEFYTQIGGKNFLGTLGQSMLEARKVLERDDNFLLRSLGEQLGYHGDPALRMNLYQAPDFTPDFSSLKVEPGLPRLDQDSFEVSFKVLNLGWNSGDSLQVSLRRILPDNSESKILLRLKPNNYDTEVRVKLPVGGKTAVGRNRILIEVDPANKIKEEPNPEAENNNRLQQSGGVEGTEFLVSADDYRALFPPDLGIVNPLGPKGNALTINGAVSDPQANGPEFMLELDTTALFNSPAILRRTLPLSGGLLQFAPPRNFWQNQRSYYWRFRPSNSNDENAWRQASFLLSNNFAPGWNQSHFFQFEGNEFKGLELQLPTHNLGFQTKFNGVIAESIAFDNVTSNEISRFLLNNQQYFRSIYTDFYEALCIAVFDPVTGQPWYNKSEFEYGELDADRWAHSFYTATPAQRRNIVNFLENVVPKGHTVLIFAAFRAERSLNPELWAADSTVYGTNLYRVLEKQGAKQVRIMAQQGSLPYIFAYVKDENQVLAERISTTVKEKVLASFRIPERLLNGQQTTQRIGPAKTWYGLRKNLKLDGQKDRIKILVKGWNVEDQLLEDLFEVEDALDSISLSEVDAQLYPYLELEAQFSDSLQRSPGWLQHWRVHYEGFGDGAIQLSKTVAKDTLQKGESLTLRLPIYNFGQGRLDTTRLRFSLLDAANNRTDWERKIPAIAYQDSFLLRELIETKNFQGAYRLIVELNPSQKPQELYTWNNLGQLGFVVETDLKAPLVDVTFDGLRIFNRDIVAPNPLIHIQLNDENRFLLLRDTSAFEVSVLTPSRKTIRLQFRNGNAQFFPSDGPGRPAKVEWQPDFVEDGEYTLVVRARDASGNLANGGAYQLNFRIIQEQSISQILPYPNPFTMSCRFAYTLTGRDEPSQFSMQIMTVSGQVVRNVSQAEFGTLRIGSHLSDFVWDGRDDYGDLLANGVYLYRIHARDQEGKSIKLFQSEADAYFKQGFGKIVILR